MIMMLKCCRKMLIHCQIGKKHGKCVLMQINALFFKSLMPINMYSTIVTSWGYNITGKNSHPYLGVEITKDLKWKTHVNQIPAKGNRALGFIKRNLSNCNEEIKLAAFNTLVWPTIEYCSAVWDPNNQDQIYQLEAIQCRAVRFIKNDYRKKTSVTELLKDTHMRTLQEEENWPSHNSPQSQRGSAGPTSSNGTSPNPPYHQEESSKQLPGTSSQQGRLQIFFLSQNC